jgi:hypothetical protein
MFNTTLLKVIWLGDQNFRPAVGASRYKLKVQGRQVSSFIFDLTTHVPTTEPRSSHNLSLSTTMDLATNLNHVGVGLYQNNCGGEAYEMFRGAVQAMLHSSGKNMIDMDPLSCHLLVQDESIQRAFGKDSPLALTVGGILSLFPIPIGGTLLYPSSSVFPPRPKSTSPDTEVPYIYSEVFSMELLNSHPFCLQFDVATCVVLYNMAMVLQRGMVPSSHKSLERALMLYSLAGRLLWEKIGSICIRCDKMTSKLYMAILNNTGYLLHELGLFDWSRLFFVRLKEFLSSLAPSLTRDEQKERDEFHLNVILFYRNLTAASAA